MSSIKEELLLKAQRDLSKLVQVQRMVSRGGKTFPQNFWVKPSEVKSIDKVIGGQQNLIPKASNVTKPAAGVLDKVYFDSLRTDKPKALDYLKSCGVTWQEHTHAGINWMRAMQAFSSALSGQSGQNIPTQVLTSQPQPVSQQNAQNSQPKTVSGLSSAVFDKLSSAQQEINACKNGKEKVVVMKKKLGTDGCIEFAEVSGISWEKNAHPAINWMRLAAALQQHFDTVDGTVSPKNGGAPKGNKNAQKNGTSTPKDDSVLKVPTNATERQKNIVNLLNSVSDETELQTYASVGMIPEDDVAKSYILEKLAPKYAIFVQSHLHSSSSKSSAARYNSNTSWGFGDQIAYDLNYEGCKKDVISRGLSGLYNGFNMAMIVNPRSQLKTPFGSYGSTRKKSDSSVGILLKLNEANAFYTTDEYAQPDSNGVYSGRYLTNMGYTGRNPKIYKDRYNMESEGFVRSLRIISEKHPELDAKCNEMCEIYDKIMTEVEGNPKLLETVLCSDSWGGEFKNKVSDFGYDYHTSFSPNEAKETIRCLDLQYDVLMNLFKEKGMSRKSIEQTLSRSRYNDNLRQFRLYDEIEDIDIIDARRDSSGLPILNNAEEQKFSSAGLQYFKDRFKRQVTPDLPSDYCDYYDSLKQIANFTTEQYSSVQSQVFKLFGLQAQHTDMNSGKTEVLDLSKVDGANFGPKLMDYDVVPSDYDTKLDAVMTNILLISQSINVQKEIVDEVSANTKSKLNGNGSDYSGNYSYYYPTSRQQGEHYRAKQKGGYNYGNRQNDTYTVSELETKLNQQLEDSITVSPDYIQSITEYYNAKSNYQDATQEAKKATFGSVGVDIKDYVDDPLKDILYRFTSQIAHYIPKMSEKGTDKVDGLMAKRLDYLPFDFKAAKQPRLSDKKPTKSAATKSKLRQLREEAYKKVHCTIETESADVSLQMRKDFLKNWDYTDGRTETTPDGFTKTGRMYSGPNSWGGYDRRALFNTRFFKINNSNMEGDFDSYQADLKANSSLDSKASEPLKLYHACSYASVAGILGATGGWFMGNQYTKVAKALGNGAYFGYKGAKSSVYCGEGSGGYQNTSVSGADKDNANGVYILADVIRGISGTDSLSDNGRFRDYEIAVKNNKCIKPHHFVDISSRCLYVNVKHDSKGNYTDLQGNITHDRYGQAVTMK